MGGISNALAQWLVVDQGEKGSLPILIGVAQQPRHAVFDHVSKSPNIAGNGWYLDQ